MNKKIIIIGGVAAGMSAASKAKRIDKSLDITVYEMTEAISWGACGLPYYVGDFYPDASLMVARTHEEFKKEGITVKTKHKVENVDFKNKKVFVRNLNENIIIIGAGYIGVEIAEAALKLGKNVRIFQHSARILNKTFDKEITDLLENHIREHEKISLHLNESPIEVRTFENKVIGLKTDKKEYTANRLIGENLTGANKEFIGTLGSAGIKVLAFEAARTGITEQEAKDNNINYKTVFVDGEDHSAYYPGGEDVYIKLIYHADTKILLGAQVAGKRGAALRADSLAVAIQNKMTTQELANMDFLYAPPFATTWDIMNVAGNVAK